MAYHERPHEAPPANKGLLWVAGVFLIIPVVALMWVSSYSRVDPKLGPFPFFIWYQMMWVFLTAVCTIIAYQLVQRARPYQPMTRDENDPQEHVR